MTKSNTNVALLSVGLGAVATTLFAGIHSIRRGWGKPIGSLSQLLYQEKLDLVSLPHLVFGAWDIFPDDAYAAAIKAHVLDVSLLKKLQTPLRSVKPFPAVYDHRYLRSLKGTHIKKSSSKELLMTAVRHDIRQFLKKNKCDRAIVVLTLSTEVHSAGTKTWTTWAEAEKALKKNDRRITPSMIYCWAALWEGCSVVNATPNAMGSISLLNSICEQTGASFAGSDLKTGQTLMKSILAPGLRARLLGVKGWFSTNILGNRDGKVLEDPGAFQSKEISKKEVLTSIFSAEEWPLLYKDFLHKVSIHYYPPRGDNKEGWDNIDLVGWLGYPMQIKINFLCRDSILAAPLVLDLALFLDWSQRQGAVGLQDWLGFYFKSPAIADGGKPEHDLFKQLAVLTKQLEK